MVFDTQNYNESFRNVEEDFFLCEAARVSDKWKLVSFPLQFIGFVINLSMNWGQLTAISVCHTDQIANAKQYTLVNDALNARGDVI